MKIAVKGGDSTPQIIKLYPWMLNATDTLYRAF